MVQYNLLIENVVKKPIDNRCLINILGVIGKYCTKLLDITYSLSFLSDPYERLSYRVRMAVETSGKGIRKIKKDIPKIDEQLTVKVKTKK